MTERRPKSFPPSYRLKKGKEFFHLRQMGRFSKTPHFLVYYLKNDNYISRLGVTVSRRVGNSPQRNRVKRLLREYFRQVLRGRMPGYDVSIIARSGASGLTFHQVAAELDKALSGKGKSGESG